MPRASDSITEVLAVLARTTWQKVSGSWEYVGEKAAFEALLDRHQGKIAEVARELDRQWAVVWRWVVKSGFDVDKYRR
jgi:hypothetical protein